MELQWKESLSIGDDVLDGEHQVVIDKANIFLDQGKKFDDTDQAQTYLTELRDHLVTHMRHEEAFQKSIKFKGRKRHRKLHRNLIAELDGIISLFDKVRFYDLTEINRKTAHFLIHFLVNHLLHEDMKIRAHFEKTQGKTSGGDVSYV